MRVLARRLAALLREWGQDATAWQGDLQALSAIEATSPKAALERFYELKHRFARHRREELLAKLGALRLADDLPPASTEGMRLREIESEARALGRALRLARAAVAARDAGRTQAATLRRRAAPPEPLASRAPWERLAPLVEAFEAWRRAVAREARVERRFDEAHRRAGRLRTLRVEVDEGVAGARVDLLDEHLARVEADIADAEAREAAADAALAPLRDAAVRAWKRDPGAALKREIDAALADGARPAAFAPLHARAEALRIDAASVEKAAARARRKGQAPPERERRRGDPIDPYG